MIKYNGWDIMDLILIPIVVVGFIAGVILISILLYGHSAGPGVR